MTPDRTPSAVPTAIVTGGSRGIGRGIALALAQEGWRLAITFRANQKAAESTLSELRALGVEACAFQADLADGHDRHALVDATLRRFGRIDLLVNNAGMAPKVRRDILEMTEESYDRVMDVNLKGPLFLTQRVASEMVRLIGEGVMAGATIVNIGSISAYTSSPARSEYCLSKAGVAMMTKLLADRLAGEGIGVYEIRPGIIATDMTDGVRFKYDRLIADGLTPIERWGTPEDIGKAVVAIAGGAFPFSTGEVINVDGGFHLRRL